MCLIIQQSIAMACFRALIWKGLETGDPFNHSRKRDVKFSMHRIGYNAKIILRIIILGIVSRSKRLALHSMLGNSFES